jgi:hypothetical protein
MADVAFIQKPWIYRGQIRGGTIFSVAPKGNARFCVYVRSHINALPMMELCCRDTAIVRMTYMSPQHTFQMIQMNHHQLRIRGTSSTSAAAGKGNSFIIGCDASAHHMLGVGGEHWHQSQRRKLHGISGEFKPEYS